MKGISPPPGDKFINRGDPAGYDFDAGDLTVTGTWTDLDLSGYGLPVGTTAVVLVVGIRHSLETYLKFRTDGQSNEMNISELYQNNANEDVFGDLIIPTNGLQVIEYYQNSGIDWIGGVVKGWFK